MKACCICSNVLVTYLLHFPECHLTSRNESTNIYCIHQFAVHFKIKSTYYSFPVLVSVPELWRYRLLQYNGTTRRLAGCIQSDLNTHLKKSIAIVSFAAIMTGTIFFVPNYTVSPRRIKLASTHVNIHVLL